MSVLDYMHILNHNFNNCYIFITGFQSKLNTAFLPTSPSSNDGSLHWGSGLKRTYKRIFTIIPTNYGASQKNVYRSNHFQARYEKTQLLSLGFLFQNPLYATFYSVNNIYKNSDINNLSRCQIILQKYLSTFREYLSKQTKNLKEIESLGEHGLPK